MPTRKGLTKYIESPEKLMEYFEAYKAWNKLRPQIVKHYNVKTDSTGIVEHERILSMQGFEMYLRERKIIHNLIDYIQNRSNNYSDYSNIIHTIKGQIFEHNLSGAASGAYQHNIIARQLGMVDKKEIKEIHDLASKEDIEKALQRLKEKAQDSLK